MRHQFTQHNAFCLNKYLSVENQMQEEPMRKAYELI